MPKFLIDNAYCTRGGYKTRWSTSLEAADMGSAQRGAHRAVNARHPGATKIDISIVRNPGDVAGGDSPETSGIEREPADAVELRIAIRLLDEQRLRGIATTRMAVSGYDTDPAISMSR